MYSLRRFDISPKFLNNSCDTSDSSHQVFHWLPIADQKYGVWGGTGQRKMSYTIAEDVKSGILNWKQQEHIRKVREDNIKLFTHTERASKDHERFIRQVRQTGVALITKKARTYGFGRPEEEHLWANFGQGAPEVGHIPGAPERSMTCTMDEITMEYVQIFNPIQSEGESLLLLLKIFHSFLFLY